MLNEKLQEALNRHLNSELYASYLYLSMGAYFESSHLKGCARWSNEQSKEELSHAMKFYNYILERGAKVVLLPIEGPPARWNSALAAFEDAYHQEQKTTAMINKLLDLAMQEKDYATQIFLQWFITEQVEEEAMTSSLVERLKLVQDSSSGLFLLDHQIGERKEE